MWWFSGKRVAASGAVALALVACGFHLRGAGGNAVLPVSLAAIRVAVSGPTADPPLAAAVRQALVQAGAKVVEAGDVPTLVLLGEEVDSRVASVNPATAKASGYVLHYSAGFRLDGPRPIAPQTVRLQRDYSFDPGQVLGQEQQERDLLSNMRQEAAREIVRRLASAHGANARLP